MCIRFDGTLDSHKYGIFVTVGSILLNCFGLEFLLPEILQLKPAGVVLRQAKECC